MADNGNDINPIDEVMTVSEAAAHHKITKQAIEYMCREYWKESKEARKAGAGFGKRGTWLINKDTVMKYRPESGKKIDNLLV